MLKLGKTFVSFEYGFAEVQKRVFLAIDALTLYLVMIVGSTYPDEKLRAGETFESQNVSNILAFNFSRASFFLVNLKYMGPFFFSNVYKLNQAHPR